MIERHGPSAPTIPLLAREEFACAKALMRDFEKYTTYDDWLDSQEGIQVGYLMAGVDARMANVSIASFRKWCAHFDLSPSEHTLFSFAEAVGGGDAMETARTAAAT
jgi:hypothetical protein